ncbi:MAG: DNA-binding protein [Desulfobulbaceae bacterium]|nr:DNA-binding protein [Desulfobulbaceae bacterium]HIJ90978.1 DNA-binding protein [Deltaproteobacteria bacterium]
MNTRKRLKYLRTGGLVLATSLLLWNPLQASAFSKKGGGVATGGSGMAGGGVAVGPSMQGISGKVAETMNSGGYTYVLLDKGGVTTWVALPQTQVVVGNEIACQPGMVMNNFTSTSLNRTFDSIVFSQGLASPGSAVAPAPTPAVGLIPGEPVRVIKVSKAAGPDGRTIGEIYEKRDALANKPVVVQGKVVKVSRGIMGKNWLHLQDGTGSQAVGTNDLVVTTDSLSEVGEVVTIKGNLSLDRDFGAGYRYDVIVEGAEVTGGK